MRIAQVEQLTGAGCLLTTLLRWKRPFRPCRWAGRINLRPCFDAVCPKTAGQASKALFP